MRKKLDFEEAYKMYVGKFKTAFDQALTNIEAEKNDGIIMDKPQAWYDDTLDETAKNFDFYGLISSIINPATVNGDTIAGNYELEFIMFVPNQQLEADVLRKKLLRYSRAFYDASKKCYRAVPGFAVAGVANLAPVNAQLNSSLPYKVVGIAISFTLVDS